MDNSSPIVWALRRRLDGELLLPGEPGYRAARLLPDCATGGPPTAIVRCSGPADVQAAVKFAHAAKLPVTVRPRGHDLFGPQKGEGALLLDMSLMKAITFDLHKGSVRAEAGVLCGELDHATRALGLNIPQEHPGHSEISALTLDEGIGWLARVHAATIDGLLAVEMILSDGTFLVANDTDNANFFHGFLRGDCPGIATVFRYRIQPINQEGENHIKSGIVVAIVRSTADTARVQALAGTIAARLP